MELINGMIELRKFVPLIIKLKTIQNNHLSSKHQIDIIAELKKDYILNKSLSKNTDFSLFEFNIPSWAEYAPLTTIEPEKCFSHLNSMFTENRTNFTEENIEKFHFIKYNQFSY